MRQPVEERPGDGCDFHNYHCHDHHYHCHDHHMTAIDDELDARQCTMRFQKKRAKNVQL